MISLAWEFLAYFPTFWGAVLWPVVKIVLTVFVCVGVSAFLLVPIMENAGRKRAEEELRKFQQSVRAGKGMSL